MSRKQRYDIRVYPDPILRQVAIPVESIDGQSRDIIRAMVRRLYARKGIGLAATQVGVLRRMIIADIGEGLLTLANPEIIDRSGASSLLEGCLSLPDIGVDVTRSELITVSGIDHDGREVVRDEHGLMARVIQHEIDHLNGVLIIDLGPQIDLRQETEL